MLGALRVSVDRGLPGWAAMLAVMLAIATPALLNATDGHFLHGSGPVNQGMGGAGTGACLDVNGSLAWNPACTARFEGFRIEGAAEYFIPWRSLSSTVGANAFGPGFPQQTLSGESRSATNAAMMPSFNFVKRRPDGRTAFHGGMLGVAGFGVDYPESVGFENPILTPQPPNGIGFGSIESSYALMKMPAGVSRLITDRLSVGVSAVPAMAMLKVTPAPFAAPVVNGSGYPEYIKTEKGSRAWGFGASVGAHYRVTAKLNAGVGYTSAIRFGDFNWVCPTPEGVDQRIDFRMDVPAVTSGGVSYRLRETTLVAADVRWIDYEGAQGFQGGGFRPDGSVNGFGWKNIWVVGGGLQQQLGRNWAVRGGYNYSQNPVPDEVVFLNTPAPAIVQHHLAFGFSRVLNPKAALHFVYYHVFHNSQSGAFLGPQGPIPGTSVTSRLRENSVSVGISRRF